MNKRSNLSYSQKIEWIKPNQKAKVSFYDVNDNLVFYDIFEKDDECGMVIIGSFDKNDVQFYWDNPPNEVELFRLWQESLKN